MRAVAFDLEVEHGGAANLREKLRKRANGHLHGQVFTLGGVEHAGDEFFLTGAAVGALAETGALLALTRYLLPDELDMPRRASREDGAGAGRPHPDALFYKPLLVDGQRRRAYV